MNKRLFFEICVFRHALYTEILLKGRLFSQIFVYNDYIYLISHDLHLAHLFTSSSNVVELDIVKFVLLEGLELNLVIKLQYAKTIGVKPA